MNKRVRNNIQMIAPAMAQTFAKGNRKKGNRLLAQLLSMQNVTLPEDDPRRGNFKWYCDQDQVTDLNAVSFVSPYLGYIAREHAAKLTGANRAQLFNVGLPECLPSFDRQENAKPWRGQWWQGNIWLLNLAGRLIGGTVLNRADQQEKARAKLDEYIHQLEIEGNGEYNSPTYLRVQLEAAHWIYHYAPDDVFKRRAIILLDYLYLDLAEHYHPQTDELSGTWSRHYAYRDLDRNCPDTRGYRLFVEAGFKRTCPSFLETLGLKDYQPPEWIVDIALRRHQPCQIWRTAYKDIKRLVYQTPCYTLATQSGRYYWPQDQPLVFTHMGPGRRRICCLHNPYFKPMAPHYIAAMDYAGSFDRWAHQHEHCAIFSFVNVKGGNDLLISLGIVGEYIPELVDGNGKKIDPPREPLMPAPPDKEPERSNVHMQKSGVVLPRKDPLERDPPGIPVDGFLLARYPGCCLVTLPHQTLTLRTAIIEDVLCVVVPVRSRALIGLAVIDLDNDEPVERAVTLARELLLQYDSKSAIVRLTGLGPELSARVNSNGGLSERLVTGHQPDHEAFVCHSPNYQRRSGEALDKDSVFLNKNKR